MKRVLTLAVLLCTFVMGASAQQQDKFTATRLSSLAKNDIALDGKGGMLVYSPHSDIVISVDPIDCNAVVSSPRREVLDGETLYCYEVRADVSKRNDARFIFSRQGNSYNADLKQNLTRNRWEACRVEEVSNPIECVEQTGRNTFSGTDGVILIEIYSTVPKLNIKPNDKLKCSLTSKLKDNDASVRIFSLSIDANALKAAKDEAGQARKDFEKVDKQLNSGELDANDDANWTRLDDLKEKSEQLAAELAGMYQIELSAPQSNKKYISIETLQNKERKEYAVNPLTETYASLLAKAQALEEQIPTFGIVSGNYTRVADAYKEASKHLDCPGDKKDEWMRKSTEIYNLRNMVYKAEACGDMARQIEARRGFDDDSVYIYMAAQYKHLGTLIETHPEIQGLETMRSQLWARMQQHPHTKMVVREKVMVKRQTISGKVTRSSDGVIPLSSLGIYATNLKDVSKKDARQHSKMIGGVHADGTYSVVMPDEYTNIYVTGEKTSHYISPEMTTLDIHLK